MSYNDAYNRTMKIAGIQKQAGLWQGAKNLVGELGSSAESLMRLPGKALDSSRGKRMAREGTEMVDEAMNAPWDAQTSQMVQARGNAMQDYGQNIVDEAGVGQAAQEAVPALAAGTGLAGAGGAGYALGSSGEQRQRGGYRQ